MLGREVLEWWLFVYVVAGLVVAGLVVATLVAALIVWRRRRPPDK